MLIRIRSKQSLSRQPKAALGVLPKARLIADLIDKLVA